MIVSLFVTTVLAQCAASLDILSLDSSDDISWKLQNKNGSIKVAGSVPGGVYSDLERAKVISDILAKFNDVAYRWVAHDTWTYSTTFTVNPKLLDSPIANLVLKGVDTVAFIELNGIPIGKTDNMFVQYVYDVKPHLKENDNILKITFVSPIEAARNRSSQHYTQPDCVPKEYHGECHANQLRKMQASFSWDWGPAFPSVGLWKSASIEFYQDAIIRSITTNLEKTSNRWIVKIRAHLESSKSPKTVTGQLRAELGVNSGQTYTISKSLDVAIRNDGTGEADISMTINENVVSLWWPNGYGPQNLYTLTIYFKTSYGSSKKTIQIGFRTIELLEEDAALKFGNETAGKGLIFYFKVNGYPIFMKGSNWIPANILPELGYNASTVDNLLKAAQEAHMNMLRVWGGGVYESDYFYERCDQLGILIWQDLLFACSMYPVDAEFLDSVKNEVEQNVLRLQHHASIAVWAGNNENEVALRGNWYNTQPEFEQYKQEYIKLYVDTIKPIVNGLDPGRRYLVSSPSNGIESERDGYIADNPYDPHYGDTHYYNYLVDNWNPNIYPYTRFASEYGFQSLPSLTTMRTATRDKEDFYLNSTYSKHRQHSPGGYAFIDSQMKAHLKLEANDTKYFEKFVFFSQIYQAVAMKTETEFYRQSQLDWYTMGALYWQLNDVWQAPSWSGIEFGGKWKMLHYFAKSFFAPILVSPRKLSSNKIEVYLLNDRLVPIIDGKINIDVFNWTSLKPMKRYTLPANAPALSVTKQDANIDLWRYNVHEVFLRFSLKAEGVQTSPFNFIFPVPLKDINLLRRPNIELRVSNNVMKLDGVYRFKIHIRTDTFVLFLWLEADNLGGHFENNGFILTLPHLTVHYDINEEITAKKLQESITYQYYTN